MENAKTDFRSVAKSLFMGEIRTDRVFPYPELKPEEQETLSMLSEVIGKVGKKYLNDDEFDKAGRIPDENLNQLKELGFFGMILPVEYGGLGLSMGQYSRCMEKLAGYSASAMATLSAHQSIGTKAIKLFGTEEQKRKFLPKLAKGQWLAAFALTEASAGSDANAVESKATLNPTGTHYILNGSKQWITNGRLADVFTVFAKTRMPEEEKEKMSAFLVTKDMTGFSVGRDEDKLGLKGSATNALFFDEIQVPRENLLGEPGKGFKIAMETLNEGRLSLGAGCLGASRRINEVSIAHAKQRQQFGQPIASFEMVRHKIFNNAQKIFLMESMVYMTSGLIDSGMEDFALEAAMVKVFSSEASFEVINHALQIAGGNGYMKEYPYERYYRDIRINSIYEGTNEILRLMIALQGLKHLGNYLKKLFSFKEPWAAFSEIAKFVGSRIISPFYFPVKRAIHPLLKKEGKMIDRSSKIFAKAVRRTALKYGKKMLQKEFLQERISNSAIDLYAMLCSASKTSQLLMTKGEKEAESEVILFKTFCQDALDRIKMNCNALKKNKDRRMNKACDRILSNNL